MGSVIGVLLLILYFFLLVVGAPIVLGWITNTGGIGWGVGFSLVLLGIQYRNLRYARQSNHWPTVEGNVVESCVIQSGTSDSYNYMPHVRYSFVVEGKEYMANTVSLKSRPVTGRRSAEEQIAAFPVGLPVVVFYNPQNPHVAVLEPGVGGGTKFLFGVFLAAVIVTTMFWVPRLEPIQWAERLDELTQVVQAFCGIDD